MFDQKSIKGSKTEINIINSFLAESQAFARYTFYAKIADKEQYFPIGVIFRETADNELHHAKVFLNMLENTEATGSPAVDAGFLGDTASNLHTAIHEESVDGYEFYYACSKTAQEEGYPLIASIFKSIGDVEKFHYNRFSQMLDHVENGTLWKREKPVTWKCLVCGFTFYGTEPPVKCPGCGHPYQHFVALDDNYVPAPIG